MVDMTARPSFLCFADQRREEVGSVLLELTVAEQRFNAVMEVLRDRLTVIGIAERYGSAAKPSTAGCAAIGPADWTPWPTAPIDPAAARTRCRPRSRPTCASYAATFQAGANAASLTSLPGSASTHRPG
jgi:hypothetical protein